MENEKDEEVQKDKDEEEDRLSILEKIERGEISIEDAEQELAQVMDESDDSEEDEEIEPLIKPSGEIDLSEVKSPDFPSKRDRRLALAEKFRYWEPQMMVGLAEAKQWPWPDEEWQWMWQNFGYPVFINHAVDVPAKGELHVVLYEGDLCIRGWDRPGLKISGAAFDVRTAQNEDIIRIACSTGQLQLFIPDGIARVEAHIIPGDMRIYNISSDVEVYCQSGDLLCERIKGNIKSQIHGGDARIMGAEGALDISVARGNTDIRNISSTDVSAKSIDGDIWLTLDSINSGWFRCESRLGDINLLTNGELSCELIVEASDGGQISPVILPWQRLLERSENKLHGVLMEGGANVNLSTSGGRIYIQESWINTSPTPSLE